MDEDSDMIDLTAGESNDDYLCLTINDKGELMPKGDQVADYVHRGQQLKNVSLWDFICQIDKLKKRKSHPLDALHRSGLDLPIDEGTEPDDSDSGDSEIIKFNEDDKSYLSILGHHRPTINLLEGYAECSSHKLKVCHPTNCLVPIPIGLAFPHCDSESDYAQYAQLMLLIYNSW